MTSQQPGKIFVLRSYLRSIFYNLLSNRFKYCRKDVQFRIHIRSERQKDYLVITVADNGMGIDMQRYRDRLFGLYQRFHFSVEGKGMGLFMTKTQVEALNGRIEMDSTPGAGTTFTISLPV